jgi:hypothetical protein
MILDLQELSPDLLGPNPEGITVTAVLFRTLTASDWLKPFSSRQRLRLIISGSGFCGMKV